MFYLIFTPFAVLTLIAGVLADRYGRSLPLFRRAPRVLGRHSASRVASSPEPHAESPAWDAASEPHPPTNLIPLPLPAPPSSSRTPRHGASLVSTH